MIRFKLQDENNNYKEYSIDIKFDSIEEFDNWVDSSVSFEEFMDQMETTIGVHDTTGGVDDDGIEYVGYHSYEIEDFDAAIEMWENFFRIHNK
jgi:antibiotic biosynthesis monooxygenase (ABM) superfamily enzyme